MARKLKNYIQHQHEFLRVESLELYIDLPSSIIIPRIGSIYVWKKMDDIASSYEFFAHRYLKNQKEYFLLINVSKITRRVGPSKKNLNDYYSLGDLTT